MGLPATMKAYKCKGPGEAGVEDFPVPALRPGYILVKVSAVALNPTDWKHIHHLPTERATVGCDYAGTIIDIGEDAQTTLQKGDRVAGVAHGVNALNPEDGAFAEYMVARAGLLLKIPDNMSDEEAATLGVAVTTVGQGMYQALEIPLPDEKVKEKTPILIYGGSTTTGLLALQYAKLSGFTVVTTCSPHNFDLVKQYGADVAFDYKDAEKCAASIRDYTNNSLSYVFDTISEHNSPQISADSLSTASGGRYNALLNVRFPRDDVKSGFTLAYFVIGEPVELGANKFPEKPEDYVFGVKAWETAARLFEAGKLKTPPIEVRSGGLSAIGEGLDDLKNNRVSGKKLVYKI